MIFIIFLNFFLHNTLKVQKAFWVQNRLNARFGWQAVVCQSEYPNEKAEIVEWDKKKDLTICCLQETHFK